MSTKKFWKSGGEEYWLRALELPNQLYQDYHRSELEFLSNHINNRTTVLDVGCGNGRSLEPIVDKVGRACGIDISDKLLEEAKKSLGQRAELRKAYAENIPYRDNTFDYVFCIANTFGNFENPDRCLDEMLRVVKQGGEVILSLYSEKAKETQHEVYKGVGLDITCDDGEAVYIKDSFVSRRFSKKTLEDIARQHNAKIEIKELTPISYIAIFRKS